MIIDAPRPEDVVTIDAIITAFYEVISGPAGAPRQWKRDAALFLPDARLIIATASGVRVETVAQYIARVDPWLVANGFFETEVDRDTQTFGAIAHVLSTYESRRVEGGPLIGSGKNSLQLVYDRHRWWIASAAWNTAMSG
jgi:hypothetical protein